MLNKHGELKSRHKHRRAYIYDDVVIKEFDHLVDFSPELSAYNELSLIINDISLGDGWLLKSPKIINAESKETHYIKMSRMSGGTIDEFCSNKEEVPWGLIGKALALFHCKVFNIHKKTIDLL